MWIVQSRPFFLVCICICRQVSGHSGVSVVYQTLPQFLHWSSQGFREVTCLEDIVFSGGGVASPGRAEFRPGQQSRTPERPVTAGSWPWATGVRSSSQGSRLCGKLPTVRVRGQHEPLRCSSVTLSSSPRQRSFTLRVNYNEARNLWGVHMCTKSDSHPWLSWERWVGKKSKFIPPWEDGSCLWPGAVLPGAGRAHQRGRDGGAMAPGCPGVLGLVLPEAQQTFCWIHGISRIMFMHVLSLLLTRLVGWFRLNHVSLLLPRAEESLI